MSNTTSTEPAYFLFENASCKRGSHYSIQVPPEDVNKDLHPEVLKEIDRGVLSLVMVVGGVARGISGKRTGRTWKWAA